MDIMTIKNLARDANRKGKHEIVEFLLDHLDILIPMGGKNDAYYAFCTELEQYEPPAVPCVDGTESHEWVVSDENENVCYCSRCGCMEY